MPDHKNSPSDTRVGGSSGPDSVEHQGVDNVRILLEAIVNSSSDAIVGKNHEGIITSWNPGAERIFGYPAAEAIGQSIQILFPAGQISEELNILARIARGEQVHSYDTVRLRKDGTLINVSVTVSPITDGHGTIVGASKIARDITERNRVEEELRESEERFRAMANSVPLLVWMARADGSVFWYNQRWYDFTGSTPEELMGWGWQSIHDPEVLPRVMVQWRAAIAAGEPFEMEYPLRGAEGWFRQFLTRAVPVRNASGLVVQWAATSTDVDELKRVEESLRTSQQLLKQLNTHLEDIAAERAIIVEALFDEKERAQVTLNSIGDAVICTDINGRVSYLNAAAERLTRWTSTDAAGRRVGEVFHIIESETRASIPLLMARAAETHLVVALPSSCILIRRDGTELYIEDSCAPIHDRDGRVTGAVMVFHDVSTAHDLSRQVAFQATHDNLTGLPNRGMLSDRLIQAVAVAHRHHKLLGMLYLDLDRFKHINDSLGHAVGDRLLQAVASRLTACVRASDTVSRLGGDEFVIMLIDIDSPGDAATCAAKLLEALRLPYVFDTRDSIGECRLRDV